MIPRLLALPGLLGEESVLHSGPWAGFLETQTVCRKVRLPGSELDWLLSLMGFNPERHPLAPGPLAVAAWNLEPPLDATQFRLDLFGLDENEQVQKCLPPSEEESAWLAAQLPRLGGGRWTVVAGGGLNWGLVWEKGSLDLRTSSPEAILGQRFDAHLPDGDGEVRLRQLIEDSRDLLAQSVWNQRRRDEGQPEIALAWPWGQGFRPVLPNLSLRLGAPLAVAVSGWSAQGLAKLTRSQFQAVPNIWRDALIWPSPYPFSITALNGLLEARRHGQTDKVAWAWNKVVSQLLEPTFRGQADQRLQVLLMATGLGSTGLAAIWDSHRREGDGVPFDERALEEPRVTTGDLWECVQNFFSAPSSPV